MNRAATSIERIVDEVECALALKLPLITEGDIDFIRERGPSLRALPLERHEGGLAHIEVEPDWVERHHRREQCRGTRTRTAPRDQISDGHLMIADAARKRSCDSTMIQIEPRISNERSGAVHGGL